MLTIMPGGTAAAGCINTLVRTDKLPSSVTCTPVRVQADQRRLSNAVRRTGRLAKRVSFAAFSSLAFLISLQPTPAHATPRVPTPGELNFVAHVHGQGFPGSDLTSYGRVNLDRYEGLTQQDSNIIYVGYQICSALAGAGANWEMATSLLGGVYNPTRQQTDAMVGYAHDDLGCGS